MKTKAFTLIEVMVVMTIISILAGMMVPAVWKFWESEEIATTRQRMKNLKIAMIGNQSLVQNGVRTHFGFVGDIGELPFGNLSSNAGNLSYLVNKPTNGYPQWSGPYLIGQSSEWYLDAWGRAFRYNPLKDASGRYVSAELRSSGPDGVFDNGDDIYDQELQISDIEVLSAKKVLTKIPGNTVGSVQFDISFSDPSEGSSGSRTLTSNCFKFVGFSRYTTFDIPRKLPIGRISIQLNRHSSDDCKDPQPLTSKSVYYSNAGSDHIYCPAD